MSKLILLLGHKMYRGKDTAAKYLIEKWGFTRVAFADSLRESVGSLYDLSWEQMTTELKSEVIPRLGITPRQILQDFGAEQRNRDIDIWARLACEKIAKIQGHVVVTDFRFPNEYKFMKQEMHNYVSTNYDIIPIRVNRKELDNVDMPGCNNISETALNDFDGWSFELNNNTTIDDLNQQMRNILVDIL